MQEYVICRGFETDKVEKWYRHTEQPLLVAVTKAYCELEESVLPTYLGESEEGILLCIREITDGAEVTCYSSMTKIKAIEFLDYLFGSYGVTKGDRETAVGRMPSVLLHVRMEEKNVTTSAEYFMKRAVDYFAETDCVDAVSYVSEHRALVEALPKYCKKAVKWAYVKTLDVAPAGTTLCIKSLESEDGVSFSANENLYIMIGCLGELYEIARSKFENSYEDSGEKLDVFQTFFDFMPAVDLLETGGYCPIDELARVCYPKPGNGILAIPLERRTKIFRKDSLDYFVGNPGDYMVIRCDDMTDIYIIQKEVFRRTYEEACPQS